jgi:hypothetical protein
MWPALGKRPATLPHRRFRRIETSPEPIRRRVRIPALYPGEPENCRRDLRQFLRVWAHVGLLLAVARTYRIEGRAFQFLMALLALTLPIHYLLPLRWKAPAAIALSGFALGWIFGPGPAAVVIGVGLVLVALTFVPIPWTARAGLVGAVALVVAAARGGLIDPPLPPIAWPMIGTLFMFRMILYLYERKHADTPERPIDALSYFFLLPNICFLHFPVVDYRTFRRGYFAEEIHATQRRGLAMMVNGLAHLLVYRIIDHDFLIPQSQVQGTASLGWYLACNYLMYLRVSGQFHVACGMLHLLGYRLPETHHHYLLATGFTDYWRRINIYWKDFMVRVVFNPVVFRMKRRPRPVALAAGTAAVFIATWLLHAYQSFWLRGSWGFSGPDALFWGILGVLVLINVQLDARSTRSRAPQAVDRTPLGLAIRTAKTAGTLMTIALLWGLWSSSSIGEFLAMLRRGLGAT